VTTVQARDDGLRAALAVCYATLAWSSLSGAAAVVEGVRTNSVSLGGLGLNILLDVVSSAILVWRFKAQQRTSADTHHGAERIASRVAAAALLVVGVSLAIGGAAHLLQHAHAQVEGVSFAVAAAGLVILPLLALWKYRAATNVGSKALHTDGHITAVAAAMSGVTLLGLLVTRGFGWWWADSTAALMLAIAAMTEGARSMRR
jgi:divalent metal cation (Fe/Co/Zn/Cd) transporter